MTTYNYIRNNKFKSYMIMLGFFLFVMLIANILANVYNNSGIVVGAALFAIGYAAFSYFFSDKVAIKSSGAQPVNSSEEPILYSIVENLAITDGIAMPKLYTIDDLSINAFATGRDPKHASVAVTRGALQKLSKTELEGVIAHEISHVKNYDIRVMSLVIVMVSIVSMLADWMIRGAIFGNRSDDQKDSGSLGIVFVAVGFILGLIAPLFATLAQMAVSRQREYLADASGALLTRNPDGLASALSKIENDHVNTQAGANSATAPMYFNNPLLKTRSLSNLFSSHPPIASRVERLKEMDK
jgi:heat shock protein HtpX